MRTPLLKFGILINECIYLLALIAMLVCSVGYYVSVDHKTDSLN